MMTHVQPGDSLRRLDARAKVTGEAIYPADLRRPGMLTAGVVLAGRPAARILRIDPSAALALPGVLAVLTAADVPDNTCGLIIPDQPVLCADLVHHAGDKVAVIVAEQPEQVEAARAALRIDYQDLPAVFDPALALEDQAPLVHPAGGTNLILESSFERGLGADGFALAEVIVEHTYHTGGQEHGFLAPEAGLAYLDSGGCLVVETAGQHAHDDRRQIAAALRLPEEQVRVIYRTIGGAFGGREDVSVQVILALAAWKLRRPVSMVWTRRESMVAHHKRHPVTFKARLGATRAGQLVAAEVEVLADGGAYISTSMPVLANAMLFCTGPYEIPHVAVHGQVVYTHNPPCGAMRGFGALQGNFCAEMQLAHLAETLGIDPVELRARNLVTPAGRLPNGGLLPRGAEGAQRCLEAAAQAGGWRCEQAGWQSSTPLAAAAHNQSWVEQHPGRGFACGWKNVGLGGGVPDSAETLIELHGGGAIEQVLIRNAAADVGQGVQNLTAQIAAHILGVSPEIVRFSGADTAQAPNSGTASASRLTVMVGNATLQAARAALQAWQHEERPARGRGVYLAPETQALDRTGPDQHTHYSLGYTAAAVTVDVDPLTGQICVRSILSALDAGKAINPVEVEGQTFGGIIMALGWTLTEKLVIDQGRLVSNDFSTYLMPTSVDTPPEMRCIIIETPDPHGPFGARGIGELPMLAIAPAILSAVHDATGVWLNHTPVFGEDFWHTLHNRETV
ncbi:MAG: xanthine dehydrogenase family protein molybdopterin-binding subunit [Chloroflexota bacterium]